MSRLRKQLILFVLIAITTLSLPVHAYDDLSPQPQNAFDQELEHMAPQYPYAENPSLNSPLPSSIGLSLNIEAPNYALEDNIDEIEDELSYNNSPSPSPSSSNDDAPYGDVDDVSSPPPTNVLPFNYSAEDDTGEFTSDEGYHVEKKNVAALGFVVGAVCLVGLGGFVLKRKDQKRKQYQNLFKRGDI